MGILGAADAVKHDTPLGFVKFLVPMQVHSNDVGASDRVGGWSATSRSPVQREEPSMGLTQPKLALNAQFGNRYEMVTGKHPHEPCFGYPDPSLHLVAPVHVATGFGEETGPLDRKGFSILNRQDGQYWLASLPAKFPPQWAHRRTKPVATVFKVSSSNCVQSAWSVRISTPDGQSATQRPQSTHRDIKDLRVKAPTSESVWSRCNAPVGHARTQTPQAVHSVATKAADGAESSCMALGDAPLLAR